MVLNNGDEDRGDIFNDYLFNFLWFFRRFVSQLEPSFAIMLEPCEEKVRSCQVGLAIFECKCNRRKELASKISSVSGQAEQLGGLHRLEPAHTSWRLGL